MRQQLRSGVLCLLISAEVGCNSCYIDILQASYFRYDALRGFPCIIQNRHASDRDYSLQLPNASPPKKESLTLGCGTKGHETIYWQPASHRAGLQCTSASDGQARSITYESDMKRVRSQNSLQNLQSYLQTQLCASFLCDRCIATRTYLPKATDIAGSP